MTATRILLTTLAMLCGSQLVADEPARPQMSLDGQWQFKLDPQDAGVAGQWFAMEATFPDQIMVPGDVEEKTARQARIIVGQRLPGQGLVRRIVTIPSNWAGKRLWLHLGGVTAVEECYVNGRRVGSVDHYRCAVTMNQDDSTYEIQDYILSRLQPT